MKVVCEMTRALLGPISDDSLYRLHLWGGEKQANGGSGGMDEYIGRAAHVGQLYSLDGGDVMIAAGCLLRVVRFSMR